MFDSTGSRGQHRVISTSPRDRFEGRTGPRQRQTECSRRPIAKRWQYRRARSSGRALFFFTARSQCAPGLSCALSPQPASSCREARARGGGEAATSRGGVATKELALRRLADFLLVGPLEQPVPDVPELQVEFVVDVARVLHLLDDGGDVAL